MDNTQSSEYLSFEVVSADDKYIPLKSIRKQCPVYLIELLGVSYSNSVPFRKIRISIHMNIIRFNSLQTVLNTPIHMSNLSTKYIPVSDQFSDLLDGCFLTKQYLTCAPAEAGCVGTT